MYEMNIFNVSVTCRHVQCQHYIPLIGLCKLTEYEDVYRKDVYRKDVYRKAEDITELKEFMFHFCVTMTQS